MTHRILQRLALCAAASLLVATPIAAAANEPVRAEADGAGFAWLITSPDRGATVAIVRDHRQIPVLSVKGGCVVENMFDAPAHASPGLITPLVSCRAGAGKTYVVAKHQGPGKAIVITQYAAGADCTDFTVCKVRPLRVLLEL